MGVTYDFRDVDTAIARKRTEVKAKFTDLGQKAVDYAVRHGNYRNRTGNLRRSNKFEATEESLVIRNDADYASNVEARGYDVLSGAYGMVKSELEK